MKVLLHGATNVNSSNFGDFLYGDLVAQFILRQFPDAEVRFFQISRFFRGRLKDIAQDGFQIWEMDALVYIPGGYFGEGHNYRLRDIVIHFLRFLPIGLLAAARRKPIAIIGIGAGPLKSSLLRHSIRFIAKRSAVVVTRDHASTETLNNLGIPGVIEAADPLLACALDQLARPTSQTRQLLTRHDGRRLLFVHYNHSREAMESFRRVLEDLSRTRSDYKIIVGSDQELASESSLLADFSRGGLRIHQFHYGDPYELVELLRGVDAVLTSKLHVGVVAAMWGTPVVCAAEHPEKTMRFYRQIHAPKRCLSVYDLNDDDLAQAIQDQIAIPIEIPPSETDSARRGWDELAAFLREIRIRSA